MSDSAVCHIRPAGRHILTIGRELIANVSTALLELVKNSYDADALEVSISIEAINERNGVKVSVKDNGHGMSRQVVIDKWMVPSTGDKLNRKTSPRGRVLQGRKGIGRFASAILGSYMTLDTVAQGKRTTLCLQWDMFENAEYLDDVEVLIETQDTTDEDGTLITIEGDSQFLAQWTDEQRPVSPACDLVVRKWGTTNTEFVVLLKLVSTEVAAECKVRERIAKFTKQVKENSHKEPTEAELEAQKEKVYLGFRFEQDRSESKKKMRTYEYVHAIPSVAEMGAKYVAFRSVISVPYDKVFEEFSRTGLRVAPPFLKDIQSRFASYYGRQGQPDINYSLEADSR